MSRVIQLRDELKEYHQSIGWEPKGNIDESNFKDPDVEGAGFWIKRDQYPLIYVIGWEDRPFDITFSYNMVEEIKFQLDEGTARQYADPAEGVDNTSIEEWAAINILDEVSEEDSNDIDFRLRDILSSFPVWTDIYYTRRDRVKGFKASKPVFPDEERFTRSTYMDALATAVTIGQRAQWFLQYTYNLGFGHHGDFEVTHDSNDLIS